MRTGLPPELSALWPNCTIADCSNKACVGLSNTLCFPHYFKLPMDVEGNAVFPDAETKRRCQRILQEALPVLRELTRFENQD